MREFLAVSYLFSPLLIGLTAHGFSIKFGWLTFLIKPIDNGKTFRGRRLFGENKTYRGVAAMALGTAVGFAIQLLLHRFDAFQQIELIDYSIFRIFIPGLIIGAAAMLSELPNSFIKRQIGIAPGQTSGGILSLFFYILDQIDYLIGVWIVLAFYVQINFERVMYSAIFLFFSHQVLSALGYLLGMRKTIR